MAASLRPTLLAELPPEIAAELEANGEVELSGVKLIDLDRRDAADTFCGVASFSVMKVQSSPKRRRVLQSGLSCRKTTGIGLLQSSSRAPHLPN